MIPEWRHLVLALAATVMVALGVPGDVRGESGSESDARTDDDNRPGTLPRAAVEIAGVSVVLIAVNDKLHALIDRVEDNLADESAEIVVTPEGGEPLKMAVEGKGWFVAPFERGNSKKVSLQVSIQSDSGAGQANAEIVYDEDKPRAAAPRPGSSGVMLAAIALFAALVGTGIAVLLMQLKWWAPMPALANLPAGDFRRKLWRFRARRGTGS